MVPSNVHKGTAAAITERLMPLMQAQQAQNHELLKHWRLHHNKAAYYEKALDGSTKFQPDVGFYYRDDGIFFVEVEFTQPLEDLVQKVEHMVQGQECWGVLAVMIKEGDQRGSLPKRHAATGLLKLRLVRPTIYMVQCRSMGRIGQKQWRWSCAFPPMVGFRPTGPQRRSVL